jgi:mannose/fructose/N-acetylgalactosamine-specific phosphotransferase system component IIC
MIDWYNLITNAFWVFGCSVVLATLSYTSWEASTQTSSFREIIRQQKIQIPLNIGGVLFAIGLVGTTQIMWQKILWVILSLGFLIQIITESLSKNHPPS